ncbi:hypothetical protein Bbelb_219360 [Branchiostoma belcheri]|nr:hypothetical protein Bbelb_219360 [Branchiostoma belcheri]
MKRLKIDIVGISETRWLGSGKTSLQSGETIIYSGFPEEHPTHVRGVGIIMSKSSTRSLKEWEPVSERIIVARFTSRCQDTTIIQAYAPTNDASDADKEQFYQQLQATMAKRKKRDITILMGDMNAKVGQGNSGKERVMGKHGVGTMNENGELFADFCSINDLVIGGTLFPHKDSHKVTWRSPDASVENQIDHITISRRWRGTLQDCRVKRSADVGSDHHLLLAIYRNVKRSCRRDKRKWISDIATEAEEAASKQDMKTLYRITQTLSGRRRQINKPVQDKDGKLLVAKEEQMERWKEHFKDILNRPPPLDPPEIEPHEEELQIRTGPPSKAEIRKAIASLKNGKAAGPDFIPAEAWKEAGELSVEVLHPLLKRIWQEEKIPQDWQKGTIIKLPKKGDLTDCKNWRGIMLISVASKILCRVILNRTANAMESRLRDNQAGFRPNRSCSDQIATLRIIVEQSIEFNSQLYAVFIDYEKAFDSVDRTTLWKILAHYGIPGKIINMVKVFYANFQAQVLHEGDLTAPFNMTTGVRQGCLLSPLLFITALDWIMGETCPPEPQHSPDEG